MIEVFGFWEAPGVALDDARSAPSALQVDGIAVKVGNRQALDNSATPARDDGLLVVADGALGGHVAPTGLAEAVLGAYRSAGTAGLSAVRGDWSAVIVDRRDGDLELVLARGARGAHPIYVAQTGSRLVFSSSIAVLLADGSVPRQVDAEALRDYLAGRAPRDSSATFLSGVRRIPAGHWVALDRSAQESERLLPAPTAFPPRAGAASPGPKATADRGPRPAALPTATELLAELPEAVRQLEEPMDVSQYLAWRETQSGASTTTSKATTSHDGGEFQETVADRWLRVGRADIQGVFRSPSFCGRPYWAELAPAESFRRACGRPSRSMAPFWRLLSAELWLRLFVDRGRERLSQPLREGELEELGDPALRDGSPAATACPPHRGRHASMIGSDRSAHLRLPVRTCIVWPGQNLTEVVDEALAGAGVPLSPGDVVVLAEKIVAISQGRVMSLDEVQVRPIARLLSRFTTRTPSGIFLGLPESFEVAIREAGLARILAGSAAAALTRPFGIRGVFYRFTGWQVAAIDSPDRDALPPSDTCIKLAPHDPDGVSARLAAHLRDRAGPRVEVAVVDVNDIGADVLGASPGVDRRLLASVLRDNPLGQDRQQTPVGIVRRVVPAPVKS